MVAINQGVPKNNNEKVILSLNMLATIQKIVPV